MNLLLLDQKVSLLSLPREDPRAVHLCAVLGVKIGDEIDLALKNGPRGKGTVSVLTDKRLDLAIRWLSPHPCDFFPVHLFVGFARPQTCRKILEQASALGVGRISFFQAEKGDPSYPKSRLWTTNEWMERIDRGVEQAFASFVPVCDMHPSLNDALSSLRSERYLRIAMDNYEASGPLTAPKETDERSIALALGPERGWSENERDLLRSQRFDLRHLGKRVLRLETAVVASLSVLLAGYWTGVDSEGL
ncbi:MAG: RsmE family RNA methyltransferase [Opitutae bacterium]|nr:RsmE family RNA methyltransferase [Opitutae bacterium]